MGRWIIERAGWRKGLGIMNSGNLFLIYYPTAIEAE
jgi:hypothetical protein